MFRSTCLAGGFILVGVCLAAMFLSGHRAISARDDAAAAPLRHVVLFKIKPEVTKEQVQEIVAGFQALPTKIDGITAFEWGTDVSPEGLADGFTHCFVVTFKDAKARDAYLPHPAHKDYVALLSPKLEKVLVIDYFARK